MKHRQWKLKVKCNKCIKEEVQDLVEESNWFDSIGLLLNTTETGPTWRPAKDSSTGRKEDRALPTMADVAQSGQHLAHQAMAMVWIVTDAHLDLTLRTCFRRSATDAWTNHRPRTRRIRTRLKRLTASLTPNHRTLPLVHTSVLVLEYLKEPITCIAWVPLLSSKVQSEGTSSWSSSSAQLSFWSS